MSYSDNVELVLISVVKLKVKIGLSNLSNKMISCLLEDVWDEVFSFDVESHLLHIYIFVFLLSQII